MRPKARSAVGLLILLAGLTAWAVGAVELAELLPDHVAVLTLYYLVAGIAWVIPARPLVRWMLK